MRDLERELGLDEALAIESSRVSVKIETRRFGKAVTVLTGFDSGVDLVALGKEMKRKFGTGGTVRDGTIELQGDHVREVKDWLTKQGYPLG